MEPAAAYTLVEGSSRESGNQFPPAGHLSTPGKQTISRNPDYRRRLQQAGGIFNLNLKPTPMTLLNSMLQDGVFLWIGTGGLLATIAAYIVHHACYAKDVHIGRLMRLHQQKTIRDRSTVYKAILKRASIAMKAPDYAVSEQREWPANDTDFRGANGARMQKITNQE
jgi:hypothetical protein